MNRFKSFYFYILLIGLFSILLLSTTIQAQSKGSINGIEISLEKLRTGCYGRLYRARGVVYEVLGVASLRPAANATVNARLGGETVKFVTDVHGVFEIKLQIPEESEIEQLTELELEIKKGRHNREYSFSVSLVSPLKATVKTDRVRYEPGETVHFWSRIDDVLTGRPLAGIPVVITSSTGDRRETVTSKGGIAAANFVLSKDTSYGEEFVSVSAEGRELQSTKFNIRKHSTSNLLVRVKTTPEIVGPGEKAVVEVTVRSITGMPLRSAEVNINVLKKSMTGLTDISGKVIFNINTPNVPKSSDQYVHIAVEVQHPGYNRKNFSASFQMRVPNLNKVDNVSFYVDILAPLHGIVPNVNDRLIASVNTNDGKPPKKGTIVEFRGAAFKGGVAEATIDAYGLAEVPVHLTREAYAMYAGDECFSQTATTIEARVKGRSESESTRLCVPVLENVLVLPFVPKPAVELEESFEVAVERRPEAVTLPVNLELICSEHAGPVDSAIASPSIKTVRLKAPKNRLGVCNVLARPMLDLDKSSTFGQGVSCPILVKPSRASFPSLKFDKEQYNVKEKASLTISTPKGAPQSFAAVAVRDLARHAGEISFAEYFMNSEFQQRVLQADTNEANLILRSALLKYAVIDKNNYADGEEAILGPEMEIDALRLAETFRNTTVGQWMLAVEDFLFQSLASETLEDIVVGLGKYRRFKKDALNFVLENSGDEEAATLGEGMVTVNMLTDFDPSFCFENVAKRVARKRLVGLLQMLSAMFNPTENDETRSLVQSAVPPERKLSEMVRRGILSTADLRDPWGGSFVIRKTKKKPRFLLSADLEGYELLSPGPDGIMGTNDDIRDPWDRVIPEGTVYARVSGEDRLMARLAAISPGTAMFENLIAAYDRLNDEAIEELIGDAVGGQFGYGGLGLSGTGSGGGGSGYGEGTLGGLTHGKLGRKNEFNGILREDFPATLYFTAETQLSSSGVTTISIPLAEAATTYIVDVIVWREDGWVWSNSAEIRVAEDLLIDSPLPNRVTLGDEIVLPISLSNRTDKQRIVRVSVTGTDDLGISPVDIKNVQIPPLGTVEVSAKAVFSQAASGKITFAAYDENNNPVDAMRRSVVVKPSKRKAKSKIVEIFRGRGKVLIDIPKGAEPKGKGKIEVFLGSAIFRQKYGINIRTAWLDAMLRGNTDPIWGQDKNDKTNLRSIDAVYLSTIIGAEWTNKNRNDAFFEEAMEVLSDILEKEKTQDFETVLRQSRVLFFLSPAYLNMNARKNIEAQLQKLLHELRRKVESGAALFSDAPWLFAKCSAALYWTAPKNQAGKRAEEMLDRANEAVVFIDGDPWFEGGKDDKTDPTCGIYDSFGASAYLALARVRSGDDNAAFNILRSMARQIHADARGSATASGLCAEYEMVSQAAAAMLGKDKPGKTLVVAVDKNQYESADGNIAYGKGQYNIPNLGNGGRHPIKIKTGGSEILMVEAEAEYAVDWNEELPHVGPFEVRIDGITGKQGELSGLLLIVRNRVPRTVREPVVEISLPAAVMDDEETEKAMEPWIVGKPTVSSDTMQIKLRPMRPKEEISIPLKWLWTAAGKFKGIGITAWDAGRPEAISVLPEKTVEVLQRTSDGKGAK